MKVTGKPYKDFALMFTERGKVMVTDVTGAFAVTTELGRGEQILAFENEY